MGSNSVFIGVTSGCGGVGTSSLAIALGRCLSRLYEKKVLYVTFDVLVSKCEMPGGISRSDFYDFYVRTIDSIDESLCVNENNSIKNKEIIDRLVSDSYGLRYLKSDDCLNPLNLGVVNVEAFLKACNFEFDYVILDVPCNSMAGVRVFNLCEALIINEGIASPHQKKYFNDCEDYLRIIAPDSKIYRFAAGYDKESFIGGDIDIHGEFGSEVRKLVAEIGM